MLMCPLLNNFALGKGKVNALLTESQQRLKHPAVCAVLCADCWRRAWVGGSVETARHFWSPSGGEAHILRCRFTVASHKLKGKQYL